MTKKELLDSKAFQDAPDDAEIRMGCWVDFDLMTYWANARTVEFGKDGRIRLKSI